jgi:hypothetical protein
MSSYNYYYDCLKQKGCCCCPNGSNGSNLINLLPLNNIWTGNLNTFNNIKTKNITIDGTYAITFSDAVKIMDGSNNVITTDGVGGSTAIKSNGGILSLTSVGNDLTMTSAGDINLNVSGGGTINVGAFFGTDPLITTSITDVNYNPEIIYYNDNGNNKIILPPMCKGQKMSLINNGVSGLFDWVQLGPTPSVAFPVTLFKQMSDGNIWIASNNSSTSAEIHIYDSTNTTQLGTITFGGALDGICQINVMLEDDTGLDYVYIGGEFRDVNGNAQNQFCITRVVRSTFIEAPLFDGFTTDYGVDGSVSTLLQNGSDLYAGGEFHFITPTTTTAECFIKVSPCDTTSGAQTYSQIGGGVSAAITKFTGYQDSFFSPILVMVGAIDHVDIGGTPIPTSNIASYNINTNVWTTTSGTVFFNNNINDIIPNTVPPTHFIVTGLFTDYVRAVSINLSTETSISGITVSSPFESNSITLSNPANCFAVDYWYEINTIAFTGVQKTYTSITPITQIMCSGYLNGNLALNWYNQSEIYEYKSIATSQDCLYSIDQTNPNSYFLYFGVDTYISYLLTSKFQATYFTANEYNSILYWTPLGQPQGSFS